MKISGILISVILTILAMHLAPVASANPLDVWTSRNPLPTGNTLTGIACGTDQFVAVGYNSTILTSPDGLNWAQQASPTNLTLTGIAFNGTNFVAVGLDAKTSYATVLTSTDGINWLAIDGLTNHGFLAVTFGNNEYVAVGYSGTVFTSPDATNWTDQASGVSNSLNGVAYGGGLFVAVGSGGGIISSPDGAIWTPRTSGTPYALNGVAYGNGTFSVVGESVFLSSFTGIAWSVILTGQFAVAVTYNTNDNLFVAWDNGHQPGLFTSSNAITWKVNGPATAQTTSLFNALTYNNSIFVAVGPGGVVATSSSVYGTNWYNQNSSVTTQPLNAIAYGINVSSNAVFVAGGGMLGDTSSTLVFSTDGTTWLLDTSLSTSNALAWTTINGITYAQDQSGNPLFVAVGVWYAGSEHGAILTSQYGVIWSTNNNAAGIAPNLSLNAVTFAGDDPRYPPWVAVGGSSTILTSMDATNWAAHTVSGFNTLYGVAFGGGRFVAVSDYAIYTSTNATNWSSVSLASGQTLRGVTYANGQFFAVGSTNYSAKYEILSSTDGTTWSYAAGPSLSSPLTGITFYNGTFVAVGSGGEIITSPDGSTWTPRISGAGSQLNAVIFGENQYITVGAAGTILDSIQPPPPPPLQFLPAIQFNSQGAAQLSLTAPAGASVAILSGSSPNNLSTMTTYTVPPNGILLFSDPSAPNSPVKFYRAKLGP